MDNYAEKNFFSGLRFVSMEMEAILDFMALAKVHITLKPLDQKQ